MSCSSAIVAVALLASVQAGCGTQCDRHPAEPPVEFKDGVTDPAARSYSSSPNTTNPFEGPWLEFPPGRTYRFPHGLGGVPRELTYWFAFSPNPLADNGTGQTGGFVKGAGNQGTFQVVTEDHVDIRNDTCSGVFLLVRLADPILESMDAGVDEDAGVNEDAGEGAAP
jgi:hypothetical protein